METSLIVTVTIADTQPILGVDSHKHTQHAVMFSATGVRLAGVAAVGTIANPDEGCDKFVRVFNLLVSQRMPDPVANCYLYALVAAAKTNDPLLASDVSSTIGAPSSLVSQQADVIIRRCVTRGYVTQVELQTWHAAWCPQARAARVVS